jgi:hypothetical protein
VEQRRGENNPVDVASGTRRERGPVLATGKPRKVAMKRVLASFVVASAFALALGASMALADGFQESDPPGRKPLRAELHISNETTSMGGNFVTASTGDEIVFQLRVKNNVKQTVDVEVTVVAGVPGCMIEETQVVTLSKGKQAKKIVIGNVPEDESGLLTIDVTAVSSLGVVETDHAEVSFNQSKPGDGASSGSYRTWHRLFLRMLTKALLAGLASDDTELTVKTSFSDFKNNYR